MRKAAIVAVSALVVLGFGILLSGLPAEFVVAGIAAAACLAVAAFIGVGLVATTRQRL